MTRDAVIHRFAKPMPFVRCTCGRASDQHAGTVEANFYLGEDVQHDDPRVDRRSDYLTFALGASAT